MKIRARQGKLVEIVRNRGKASVGELAQLLGASRETIRRDLAQLARAGRIHKVHGGATLARIAGEGSFRQRLSANVAAKSRIAATAAALFRPGETLMIDTGSTTLFFAEQLAQGTLQGMFPGAGLTVVTNCTEIARTIAQAGNGNRVFLLGGEYGADNSQTTGPMVSDQIGSFRAHHAVLTVGALDSRTGAMDFNMQEAQVARAMIRQAESLTVLADRSKFDALASFAVCPLDRIDRLVCDAPPPADIRKALERAGGELVIAAAAPAADES